MSTKVDENRKRELRQVALENAVRHRIKEEKADDIVKSAEKYYQFLLNEE